MSFITLHYLDNKEPVYVNIDRISCVTKTPTVTKEHAIVEMGVCQIKTAETYDEVTKLIYHSRHNL